MAVGAKTLRFAKFAAGDFVRKFKYADILVKFADTKKAAGVDRICVDVYIRVNLARIAAVSVNVFGDVFVDVVKHNAALVAPRDRRVQQCAAPASV